MEISTFEIEKEVIELEDGIVVGLDEAGRGPLAGPVVACAACVKNSDSLNFSGNEWDLIRDSKTLSPKQREKAFEFVKQNFFVGVGICNQNTIDRINILESSFLAMKKATQELKRNMKNEMASEQNDLVKNLVLLVDGNKEIPNFSGKQMVVPKGDKKVKSISAASIIAKVTRDRIMLEAHKKYPHYGFDKHKGYGTKFHMESLKNHGPCKIHRKSFAPVRKASNI